MATKRVSDAAFERQYELAKIRGAARQETAPRAEAAFYDRDDDVLVIEFNNGASVDVPRKLLPELRGASPDDLAEVELMPGGSALHWENLDVDFSVAAIISSVILSPQTGMSVLARAGGSTTSEAKAAAARINGLKGGRPVTRDATAGRYITSSAKTGAAKNPRTSVRGDAKHAPSAVKNAAGKGKSDQPSRSHSDREVVVGRDPFPPKGGTRRGSKGGGRKE